MGIFGWILFGFLIGLIFYTLLPSGHYLGLIGIILIGIVGALLGGWLGRRVLGEAPPEGVLLLMASSGAAILLSISQIVVWKRQVQAQDARFALENPLKKAPEDKPQKAA